MTITFLKCKCYCENVVIAKAPIRWETHDYLNLLAALALNLDNKIYLFLPSSVAVFIPLSLRNSGEQVNKRVKKHREVSKDYSTSMPVQRPHSEKWNSNNPEIIGKRQPTRDFVTPAKLHQHEACHAEQTDLVRVVCSAESLKNPCTHKNKMGPPRQKKKTKYPTPQNQNTPPPKTRNFMGMEVFLQKEPKIPRAHKTGAAISGPSKTSYGHAQYDWTTEIPDNGNEWRKFRAIPRLCPLGSLVLCFV